MVAKIGSSSKKQVCHVLFCRQVSTGIHSLLLPVLPVLQGEIDTYKCASLKLHPLHPIL